MTEKNDTWTKADLLNHLQYAADLELWTIPFYMSAMYSIIDRSSDAFQLVQSVVNQEMLHLQSASNIANAYGLSPAVEAPIYEGQTVPHLDFALDSPDPRKEFSPYSAEIGPLDEERVNAMCLIEYPEWDTGRPPDLKGDVKEYGSIGEFYDALRVGTELFKGDLHGGVKQIDFFSAFYRNMPNMKISDSGNEGFFQVSLLIDLITDQGEGAGKKDEEIPLAFQNTADDGDPEQDHYEKFIKIRDSADKPQTYPVKSESQYSEADRKLLATLVKHFTEFRGVLEELFSGKNPDGFVELMMKVGADIQSCWKNGVTPRFS